MSDMPQTSIVDTLREMRALRDADPTYYAYEQANKLEAALEAVLGLADKWQADAWKVTNVYGKQVVSVEFTHAEIVNAIEKGLASDRHRHS